LAVPKYVTRRSGRDAYAKHLLHVGCHAHGRRYEQSSGGDNVAAIHQPPKQCYRKSTTVKSRIRFGFIAMELIETG
jgi:hypothetical protein